MARPIIRWAGGKSQLLHELMKHVPLKYDSYYEPFVGGGAMFFALKPEISVLSDSNGELINTYTVVRDNVEDLIRVLPSYRNDKEFFLEVRSFNPMEMSDLERAARFIFLNKTCFNGLWRVNSKNVFNVPFGNYKNPKICDAGTLRLASKALQGVNLQATYYQNVILEDSVSENAFMYLDPPYLPVSDTSFVAYSKKGFGLKDHEQLADSIDQLTEKNVKVLLSNSDTSWVRERYSEYRVIEVKAKRSINSNGKGRGKVSELLIKNY